MRRRVIGSGTREGGGRSREEADEQGSLRAGQPAATTFVHKPILLS